MANGELPQYLQRLQVTGRDFLEKTLYQYIYAGIITYEQAADILDYVSGQATLRGWDDVKGDFDDAKRAWANAKIWDAVQTQVDDLQDLNLKEREPLLSKTSSLKAVTHRMI